MPLTAGGRIETDDEADARVRLGLGDVEALGRDCTDEVMNPDRSVPCLRWAKGGVHHSVFFRENHANVATYCAAYIDVLARFRVWGEKKSHVNERDRTFTEKRLRWRSRSTDNACTRSKSKSPWAVPGRGVDSRYHPHPLVVR